MIKVFHTCTFTAHKRITKGHPAISPATQAAQQGLSTSHLTKMSPQLAGLYLVSPPEKHPLVLLVLLAAGSALGGLEVPSIADKNCILYPRAPLLQETLCKRPPVRLMSPRRGS